MSQMTWKEFKEKVEELGAKDTDKIWYIDISFPSTDSEIIVSHDEHGGLSIQ